VERRRQLKALEEKHLNYMQQSIFSPPRISICLTSGRKKCSGKSNNASDYAHGAALEASGLLLAPLHAFDAVAPLFGGHAVAGDESLALPHAAVDVDIPDLDPDWAVGGASEPAVYLPHKVEEDQQGAGKVVLEEDGGSRSVTRDGEQRGVERRNKSENVDEDAEV